MAWAEERGWAFWLRLTLGICGAASAVCAQVLTINALVFGAVAGEMELRVLVLNILAIVAIVTLAIALITRTDSAEAETTAQSERTPRLLDRLPPEIKGNLVSLSVTDHYVHVTTRRGTHMLLMRLSDAIAETTPTPGFQVHRSHWVAQDAIQGVARTTRKSEVVLQSGARLPVSRTYLPQLKEAGFLSKNEG